MKKFIFIHIPKTAGGTFRHMVDSAYGNRSHRDTGKYYRGTDLKKDPLPKEIIDKYDFISGHHSISRYKNCGVPFVTIIREPIERVISSYYYLKNLDINVYKDIKELADAQSNYMSRHIEDTNKFHIIGFQEYFNDFVSEVERWINMNLPRMGRKNPAGRKGIIKKDDRQYIKSVNKLDYEIYNTLLEKRFGSRRKG